MPPESDRNSLDKDPASDLIEIFKARLGARFEEFLIPPPVFTLMEGEFLEFDQPSGWLKTRFPIKPEYQNPYHFMQGGMIAAAIDNTFGPLSVLVAGPNVTRTLEVKYISPVKVEMGFLYVDARYLAAENRFLKFSAEVRSVNGLLLARAWARHWLLDDPQPG